MSQGVTQSLLLLAVAVALFQTPSPAQLSRAEFLAIGKATLVSEVEPGLPDTPFEAWLEPLVGPGASFSWEINDCGEQSRITCVGVEAFLPGGRSVYLYFRVGTESGDGWDAVESRALWFVGVFGGERDLSLGTLAALATHLREERR